MNIQSVCANASILRIISQTHRMKWASCTNKHLLCSNKVFPSFCEPISRVVCTDSNLQCYKYEIQEIEKDQHSCYVQESFLKENFNIVDSRYFKLVTLPSECNNLEQLLWTNEFKKVLCKSPFSYDVSLLGGPQGVVSEVIPLSAHVCEDILQIEKKSDVSEDILNGLNVVFYSSSDAKETLQGRASEEQLLHIIDRLTHSLIKFFEQPHDYTIYHKNIVFQNNIKGVTIRGLNAYAQALYLMRFYGFLHFAKVKVEILKMTHHTEDGTVRVRWRVNGLPRHKLVLLMWRNKSIHRQTAPLEETEWLDGFSIFSVGADGLIYKHICDKMIPDDEKLLNKNVDFKSKVLGLLGLTPRGPAAAAMNTLIPCCRNPDLLPCKKLT